MPFPTIATPASSQHRTAGFQSVFARPSGGKYQTLGGIMEGVLNINLMTTPDSKKQNKTNNVYEFTAVAKMKQTSLVELELLDSLVDGTNSFLFKLSDAEAIPITTPAVTEGWVLVSASQVGCKISPDLSGDSSTNRFILLEWRGTFVASSLDAVVKASIVDTTFEGSGDTGTFHAIGTYTVATDGGSPKPANNRTGGISTLTLGYTGGAAQTLGPIKNFKLTFTGIADDDDSLRIYRQHAYDVLCEYDWPLTNAPNLVQLDSMSTDDIDAVITFVDGLIVTLTNRVGISTNFESGGDYDKERVVRFTHSGTIRVSDLDAIVSV